MLTLRLKTCSLFALITISSIKRYHPELGPGLTDRALSEMDFEAQHEISQEEFEEAWNEAIKHAQ